MSRVALCCCPAGAVPGCSPCPAGTHKGRALGFKTRPRRSWLRSFLLTSVAPRDLAEQAVVFGHFSAIAGIWDKLSSALTASGWSREPKHAGTQPAVCAARCAAPGASLTPWLFVLLTHLKGRHEPCVEEREGAFSSLCLACSVRFPCGGGLCLSGVHR